MAAKNEVLNRIYSLSKMGIKLGLDNMEKAMDVLGIDLSKMRLIHVAGTNGKGSTSAMLHKLICDHSKGSKVALYTSPHLLTYNERIRINSELISDEQLIELASTIFNKCKDIPLTFFEFTTLIGFMHFIREGVEFAVIETGLGGRLDATNVILPEICIITSISEDHMEYLGNSLEDVAREKAGILKKGSYAVISRSTCQDLIRKEAEHIGAKRIFGLGQEFNYKINDDKSFNVVIEYGAELGKKEFKGLKKSLIGDYQFQNASCAIMAFDLLGIAGTNESITKALGAVDWRGRLERHNIKGKTVYLDVSHNPEGIYATVKFLLEYHKNDVIHIACGFMKDKDYATMIKMLHGVADKMFLMPTNVEGRQTSADDYRSVIDPKWKNVQICKDYREAVEQIMKEDGVIVFTGSMFNFEHISKLLEGSI
ncbi:MAG: Mur ligase family protein [bacterium]